MSTNSFSFPPPPPPPPQATYAESTFSNNSFSRGRGDRRWERGSRGRGRGTGQRGPRGGSHDYGSNSSDSAPNGAHFGGSYPLPNYPPVQQLQYTVDPRNAYSNSPPAYAPVASPSVPQQTYPYYPPSYQVAQPQAASNPYSFSNYNPHVPQYPYQLPNEHHQYSNNRYASPPVAIGPPIRLGFGAQDAMNARSSPQAHHDHFNHVNGPVLSDSRPPQRQRGGRGAHNRRGNPNTVGASTNSRSTESTKQQVDSSATRKTQVAPAVPSFGNPLPVKPPAIELETKKAKKKRKRRVNQLGLTPKTDEHVSSSEDEEDVDEELKLATTVVATSTAQQLEFTYKGRTSTLQTSDDIASWLEERKKRFPTAARKAENEERLRQIGEEREEKKRAQQAERLLERQKRTLEKDKQAIEKDKQDAAARAKLKVEKLRHKLEKEERRIAKAEAKSLKRSATEADKDPLPEAKRLRRDQSTGADESGEVVVAAGASHDLDEKTESDPKTDASHPIPEPLTPTSQPALPDAEVKPEIVPDQPASELSTLQPAMSECPPAPGAESEGAQNGSMDSIASAGDISVSSDDTLEDDDEDDTSSSGSSSSNSELDAEGPETASSRQKGPRKVPPPKRVDRQEKAICRDFLQTGRCRRGRRCRWRHALPERGQRKAEDEMPFRVERKSLHQRLVEQELEKDRQEKKKLEQHDCETKHDTQITTE